LEVFNYNGGMKKPLITSLGNPLVKQARAMHQKKVRRESGLFLVEGIHHVGEVIEAGWDVESVLYTPDTLTSGFAHDLIARLGAPEGSSGLRERSEAQAKHTPQPVTLQVMESIADKDNPQGILAIVRQRQTRLEELGQIWRAVALVSPQDPGNVGTILRTMDAVGADALFLLDGGVELYHPSIVRSSMGTLFWKPVVQTSFDQFVKWARGNHFQLIGTSAHGDVEYHTLVPRSPWAVVLGNEQKGLSVEQNKACDVTISLPMKGRVSSLNLAVAAGVFLYRYSL
jgi:RNA methyltransferase, TrmH family